MENELVVEKSVRSYYSNVNKRCDSNQDADFKLGWWSGKEKFGSY